MRHRSLTLAQREVLLAFLTAADDQRRQTLGDLPGEPWDAVAAFDELLDMGLLKVVPCVRLEIRSEFLKGSVNGKAKMYTERIGNESIRTN